MSARDRSRAGPLAARALLLALAVATPHATPATEPAALVETIVARRAESRGVFPALPRWTAPGRPSVALALSGGGARGIAHLGVLRALRDDGVEIDAVAGTSIGALMGAFVCAGYAPEEVEEILRRRDWDAILSGLDARRRVLSEAEDVRESSALFRYRFRRGRPIHVGALVESRSLERELNRYFLLAQLESGGDFDRLACRFRAVAADILAGAAIAPRRGDLATLVRGSSSVPGVFRPVQFGDALLVDGGIVENIPVDTAQGMGADLVVAVDVTEGIQPTVALRGALDSLYRSVSVLMAAQGSDSLERADFVVTPDVGAIPHLDFARSIDELVAAGEAAYAARREALWATLEAHASDPTPVKFGSIEVQGTARVDPSELAGRLGGIPGSATRFRIAAELARALNAGPFETGRVEVVEDAAARRLRFVFLENPPLREVVLEGPPVRGEAPPGFSLKIGEPFSYRSAEKAGAAVRQALIEEGKVLVRAEEIRLDPATGVLRARVADAPLGRITTEVEGELRLERTRRFFEDFEGKDFAYDRLADRLDDMVARGAIFDWSLEPARGEGGAVDLRVRVRGDDYFDASAGGAYRGDLSWAGFVRAAKSNLTGRGDFVDLTVSSAVEGLATRARYRTEYGVGFQNLGAEIGAEHHSGDAPFVDAEQRPDEGRFEGYRGERVWASLIRRLVWGTVAQGGVRWESDRFDPVAGRDAETRTRTSAFLDVGLDRRDRLLFPTRGGSLRLNWDRSLAGSSLWRAEARGEMAMSPGAGRRHTWTLRAGVGVSGGAERRLDWFDPGGHRDLYGFIPYGAAAPQYARAGVTWRLRWLDTAGARVYLEAGADAVRTGAAPDDLRRGGAVVGCGMSLTAFTRFLGPLSLGVARNDAGASTVFLTAGYSFWEK